LKRGEIIKSTDIFLNGHEVESYVVGTKYVPSKYYSTWREVKKEVDKG
jgi:hypothetical protein